MSANRLPLDALAPPGEIDTFVRGFALGRLFQLLDAGLRYRSVSIRPDLVYDADLVAMATGYVVVSATDEGPRVRLVLEKL